jgi:hypothetical protein
MTKGFQFRVMSQAGDMLEMRVSAWNGVFGGATVLYVPREQLQETAARLEGFPSAPGDAREVILGGFGTEVAGGAVSMLLYCAERSGDPHVEAKIEAGEITAGTLQSATLSLPVDAAAVASFVADLRRLAAQRAVLARLRAVEPAAA